MSQYKGFFNSPFPGKLRFGASQGVGCQVRTRCRMLRWDASSGSSRPGDCRASRHSAEAAQERSASVRAAAQMAASRSATSPLASASVHSPCRLARFSIVFTA